MACAAEGFREFDLGLGMMIEVSIDRSGSEIDSFNRRTYLYVPIDFGLSLYRF